MLGYTKAVKEIRGQERDAQKLNNSRRAAAAGIQTSPAAAARILPDHAPQVQSALHSLRGPQAPPFGARRR